MLLPGQHGSVGTRAHRTSPYCRARPDNTCISRCGASTSVQHCLSVGYSSDLIATLQYGTVIAAACHAACMTHGGSALLPDYCDGAELRHEGMLALTLRPAWGLSFTASTSPARLCFLMSCNNSAAATEVHLPDMWLSAHQTMSGAALLPNCSDALICGL